MNIFKRYISVFLVFFIAISVYGGYFLFNIKNYIKRGIDLAGGTLITLDVDFKKAYSDYFDMQIEELLLSLKQQALSYKGEGQDSLMYSFLVNTENEKQALLKHLKEKDFVILEDGLKITITLSEKAKEKLSKDALSLNIKALKNRLDPFGAGEIVVIQQGDRISVELPSVQNLEEARLLIGKTALLEIKPVFDSAQTVDALYKKYDNALPAGTMVVEDKDDRAVYLVLRKAALTGAFLEDAHLAYDPNNGNKPVVAFKFNRLGGEKFKQLTRNHIGQQIAIVLDNEVITAPSVNQEIGSSGIIQGNFTMQDAQNLAKLLKAGAFVAPVKIVSEQVVGPALGYKTINQGLISCLFGLLLLFIASILIYKVAGFFAFLVLIYNLIFTLIGMYLIGATLTLSGIAGLILTLGMAIDASILIYEKIREELRTTANFKTALNVGFSGAMEVIIDANITHFIVAVVLYKFGLGPLKGFAISMIVGIISTIISGIFLLRGILNYLVEKLKFNFISI